MVNVYKIKKWAALLIVGFFSVVGFFVGLNFYGLLIALACWFASMMVAILMAFLLLKNPFSSMIEGKGILCFDMNSTGIIQPFIVGLRNPDIIGKHRGVKIKDVFDRNAVYMMKVPQKNVTTEDGKAKDIQVNKDGSISFTLNQENYNKARFAMMQFPVLIYNSHLNTFITKDFFSEMEKSAFAEHTVLYLNRNMQELTGLIRDFGRYVVETLKPKGAGLGGKWTWIIIGVVLVILAAIFAPSVIKALQGGADSAGSAVSTATPGTTGAIQHATPTGG